MIPIANYNLGSVQGSIDIDYDSGGTTEARADIRRLAKELEQEKLLAKIEADTRVLQRKRDEAVAMLETLVAKTWTPEVQVEIDNARAQVTSLEYQLSQLDGKRVNIQLDMDESFNRASAAISDADVKTQGFRRTITQFGADARDTRAAVETFGNALTSIAKPVILAGAAGAVGQLTAALVPAIGAIGILPGVLGAAGAAMAVVKIGTSGVGDAMKAVAEGDAKKLAEAMAKLSPEAQNFVRSYQAIKPALDSLKMDVQNALFKDMGVTLGQLGGFFLPSLHTGLVGVAGSMNELGRFSAQALMTPGSVAALNTTLSATSLMFDNMGGALGQFLSGFLQWMSVGSSFLPQFGSWFQNIAEQFQAWTDRMVSSGQAWTLINNGLMTLKQLWQILVNIGAIVGLVFKPLMGDAGGLLATIVQLTGAARAWLATAEGQQTVANIWTVLKAVAGALMTVISTLAPVIAAVANAFAALPAPVQNVLAGMAAWGITIGFLLLKIAPLITGIVGFAQAMSAVPGILTSLVSGFRTVMTAFRALSLLMMTNPWILLIAAIIALVIIIVTNWDTIKGYLAAAWEWIASTATTVWNGIVNFFSTIFSAIVSFFATWGPTILAVLFPFLGIPLLIWQNWDAIVAWLTAVWYAVLAIATVVWNAIVAFFTGIWNGIVTVIMTVWTTIITFLITYWTMILTVATTIWTGIVNFFTTIWTGIVNTVTTVWNTIVAFLTMIWNSIVMQAQVLWMIMVTVWQTVWNTVVSVAMSIWNTIVSFLSTVWNGIVSLATTIWNAVLNIIRTVWNNVWGFLSGILSTIGGAISSAWNAITSTINGALNAIWGVISSVWNRIIGFFTGAWNTISGIFSGAVGRVLGILGGLWNTITGLAGSAISLLVNAGRNIVIGLWNGIVAMGSWLYGAIMGWIRSVVPGPILSFLGIASPSRFMRDEVGKHIPTGIAAGIEDKAGVAANAALNLAGDVGDAAKTAVAKEVISALDAASLANIGANTSQIGALTPAAQNKLGALALSTGAGPTGATPVQAATAAAAQSTAAAGPTTINIGTLSLSVEGNLDPTDPVRWRRAMEQIREGITNVEASYR